jgi:Lipoprotein LpqB beta-propeller domain/Sporulation and spore germination
VKLSRPARVLAALLVAGLCATGCVSMPTGGPVQSYPVTQAADAQNQPYVQVVPQSPGDGWKPSQIVQGFLTASASFGTYSQVAMEYLTPAEQKGWDPSWSATVYKDGPNVADPAYPAGTAKNAQTATVRITGTVQANLQGYGNYSVPSASGAGQSADSQPTFTLVKENGQWRISQAPTKFLLTNDSFQNDYQLSKLYFLNPDASYLVPDPVYVPVTASLSDLMNGLVSDLITPPPGWLSGATKTAFPVGTKIRNVSLNGVTAVVNLTGAAMVKASGDQAVMQQISSQLFNTLYSVAQSGSAGTSVQSLEVEVNDKPWPSSTGQGNAVQQSSVIKPATGSSSVFYYVADTGYLDSQDVNGGSPTRIEQLGTGVSQVAVSRDGSYVAALRGDTLYTGVLGGVLSKRGSGYTSISWDIDDDLWAAQGDEIMMFRSAAGQRQVLGEMVQAAVTDPYSFENPTVTLGPLRVAPDGVRVAIVIGGTMLAYGAISGQQSANPQITLSPVQEQAVNASTFSSLTWYGSDDVITLSTPGSALTEYSVSGGSSTSISSDSGMKSITAGSAPPLIAGLSNGGLISDASLMGAWTSIGEGSSPAYPG